MTVGLILVIIAAVLGGLCIILGLIYAYIYCFKLRPRPRPFHEQRVVYNSYADQNQSNSGDDRPIKTHPFFIMHYVSKLRADNGQTSQIAGSPRRH